MRGLNFLIHYNKVEVYALIFGHILFNTMFWQSAKQYRNVVILLHIDNSVNMI
jgi:hypothetical protein